MQTFVSCPIYGAVGVYGMPSVPLDVHSFSCSPPSPVHVGDTLTFIAEIGTADNVQASVTAGNGVYDRLSLELHDDGLAPDATAGDNIFTGSGQWLAKYGTGATQASLTAYGNKPQGAAFGHDELPLDVLP